MTYDEWIKDHDEKVNSILSKLGSKFTTPEEIASYFDYENMKTNETSFCPLYKDNIKCHNVDDLNCLLCACPHFIINNDIIIDKKIGIASVCGINSKFKDIYYENPDINNVVKVHCDCTNCFLPHKTKYVINYLRNKTKGYIHSLECNSLLEYIRQNNILK